MGSGVMEVINNRTVVMAADDGDEYRGGCHWRVTAAKMEVVEVVNMVVIMVTTTTVL